MKENTNHDMFVDAYKKIQSDFDTVRKSIAHDYEVAMDDVEMESSRISGRAYRTVNQMSADFNITMDDLRKAADDLNEYYVRHEARRDFRERSLQAKEEKTKARRIAISKTTKSVLVAAAVTLGVTVSVLFFVCVDMVENGGMTFKQALNQLMGGMFR